MIQIHFYSECGTGFDSHGGFLLSDGSGFDKNVIIFSADMNLYVHTDNFLYQQSRYLHFD